MIRYTTNIKYILLGFKKKKIIIIIILTGYQIVSAWINNKTSRKNKFITERLRFICFDIS